MKTMIFALAESGKGIRIQTEHISSVNGIKSYSISLSSKALNDS